MTSDVDRPSDDVEWNFAARHETPIARLDRHWTDLLQELRVAPVVPHRMRLPPARARLFYYKYAMIVEQHTLLTARSANAAESITWVVSARPVPVTRGRRA